MQLGMSTLGGDCCRAGFGCVGCVWATSPLCREQTSTPAGEEEEGHPSTSSRRIKLHLKCPWGAHMQRIRGMQAEPLPVLPTLLVSISVLCDVYDTISYDPSHKMVKKSWTKQTQCFPTDKTLLCKCVLFFLKALLAFSYCFYPFRYFHLSNWNLNLAFFMKIYLHASKHFL